ncbi:MAG: 2-oxo-4-hydroxy-4-carboxy-5-ureidoimidazoline decarboxylase [Burkholderiales bacterium]
MPTKTSLAAVNTMSADAFNAVFGRVFEHSPWIAERALARRPFESRDAMHRAMCEVVEQASLEEKIALLRAHPELAGKEAQSGSLTPESTTEQQRAGLDALSKDEMVRIARLNRAHAGKFGFPFIIAARLNAKDRIFAELERRNLLDREAELAACIEQVYLITRLRIDDLIADSSK